MNRGHQQNGIGFIAIISFARVVFTGNITGNIVAAVTEVVHSAWQKE
jgi:uncharacterized membrane protein YoaK (UPF0700 family)